MTAFQSSGTHPSLVSSCTPGRTDRRGHTPIPYLLLGRCNTTALFLLESCQCGEAASWPLAVFTSLEPAMRTFGRGGDAFSRSACRVMKGMREVRDVRRQKQRMKEENNNVTEGDQTTKTIFINNFGQKWQPAHAVEHNR